MNIRINTLGFMLFIAFVATILLTVLAYIFIVPEEKRDKLNKLGQFIHDIFNFKFLIVEKILQFFYVLTTIAAICGGLCMIPAIRIHNYEFFGETYTEWYGIYGILLAVLGPIVIRIVYESLMMFILLVKNVIQINKKLKSQTEEEAYKMPKFKELVDKENFEFIKNIKDKKETPAPPQE